MSDWIDNDYAIRLLSIQPRYKIVSTLPMKITCRCPVCGDSQKDEFKARFWYYFHKGTPFVHCFNCDYSSGFARFLEEQDAELFREYQMEKFKDGATHKPQQPKVQKPIKKQPPKVVSDLGKSYRLDRLPLDHPIIKYVESRKIPKDKWNRLWFTSEWQQLCNKVKPGTFENPVTEHRLVIPIRNREGKIESFQGRALKKSNVKYMTIKADENASKIYGHDTVDESLDYVLILEGPIDSLFLDNAMAITGGSLNLDVVPYKDKRIWVLDSECRHPDTIKRMEKLIDAGETVCFWDAAPWKSKDINDMVAKEGADPKDITEYILNNSESGLMAKLRMSKFCKI